MTKALIRIFDFLFSIIAFIIFLPLFIVVVLAIIAEDFGPAFFTQLRIGKDEKKFKVVKFRTMHHGAEKLEKEMFDRSGKVNLQMENDPRVTGVGKFLRKHSLDELPQILNVIVGQMSLVGPRPLVPLEVELFSKKERERFKITPGITGLAQLYARRESNKKVIKYDIIWVRNYSLYNYFAILFKTLPKFFRSDGV